jgi:hypothetical protein
VAFKNSSVSNFSKDGLFSELRSRILNLDPVVFVESHLTLDGKPFRLNNNGYKPFADIYRYIAVKAVEPNAKPIVLVKGRQVGATTMAAALECYFMTCGLFGNNSRSPMRIMHLFPTLGMAAAYTKDKLDPMIGQAIPEPGQLKPNGLLKSFMESRLDASSPANNNQTFKKFYGGNQIWIESTGVDGNRVRGRTVDCAMFDECFPYEQCIETETGNVSIGKLYDWYLENKPLPLVKTYNESIREFEYKKIVNVWQRGERELVQITCGNTKIKCTPNHKFLTSDGWKKAFELNFNDGECDDIETSNGESVWVDDVSVIGGKELVYDIEVEDNHNFCLSNCGFIVHNCQDIPGLAIGAVNKILAQGKYGLRGEGVQVYFGTPKQKGTEYWKMWQNSSQQYYHLHCEKCGEYFPLYRPDTKWEEVWLYGFIVKCTYCGHEQDKNEAAERGKWIPLNANEETDYVGYHINQLYIPHFTRETIDKAKPEKSAINTERIYQNEVLGEFYDGEGGTVSLEEIHTKCADNDRKCRSIIGPSESTRVYAGFDWGQRANLDQIVGRRQGQSYSCGVILTAEGPRRFNVEYAVRLIKNDPQSKVDAVEEMFRRYSITLAVGDIGDAFDLSHKLQRMYGRRFLASRALPRIKGYIRYHHDIFPKTIVFERDYYISELIGLLKEGAIRFPYGSFDQIDWLVSHCCSMDIKITKNRAGDPVKHYVKGVAPNDGFMALLNAYFAWKFDVTQGFKIKQPDFWKYEITSKKRAIPAIVGYIKRRV